MRPIRPKDRGQRSPRGPSGRPGPPRGGVLRCRRRDVSCRCWTGSRASSLIFAWQALTVPRAPGSIRRHTAATRASVPVSIVPKAAGYRVRPPRVQDRFFSPLDSERISGGAGTAVARTAGAVSRTEEAGIPTAKMGRPAVRRNKPPWPGVGCADHRRLLDGAVVLGAMACRSRPTFTRIARHRARRPLPFRRDATRTFGRPRAARGRASRKSWHDRGRLSEGEDEGKRGCPGTPSTPSRAA